MTWPTMHTRERSRAYLDRGTTGGFVRPITRAVAARGSLLTVRHAVKPSLGRRRAGDGVLLGPIRNALAFLPQGRLLPERSWRRRHRWIVVLVWLHAVGLAAFGVLAGFGFLHSVAEAMLVAAAAIVAGTERFGRRFRSLAASFGLITSSALLVHLSGGLIEAHFHFFVVIPILVLYQDWFPFLLALAYVVVHHGLLGAVEASSVYNHPDAVAHPWRWALIHGVFVIGASAASLVGWRANEQLLHEPLTGLAGRAFFLHKVSLALDRLKRRRSTLAVLFIDLDRFKVLNDTLGHSVGDELLVAVARRLKDTVRTHDTVARLGGDEFAVLCEVTNESGAIRIADRISTELSRPFVVESAELVTGASIGIVTTDSSDLSPEVLIGKADTAMYRAKSGRGSRTVVFDEAMGHEDAARLATENALRGALARQELHAHYQPIVSLLEGRTIGAEALLRWRHPQRGLLPPADFIPIAEQSGLIVPIGAWMLAEACREAARWSEQHAKGQRPSVSVNLSPRQLAQTDLVETVAGVLSETGLDPAQLGLEITESALMDDADSPLHKLSELKRLGVRLLLDDFGTGYSSLSYLRNFPFDVVKIDRSFVATLGESEDDGAILKAVVQMAAALEMSVIAEGVETREQADRLAALGYDRVQGFYFGRPKPATELETPFGRILASALAKTA
jgi:diguanylate cyclase (GGDEF)-like protein